MTGTTLINDVKTVFIHIRWPLQSFTLLGFLFGIVASKSLFSQQLVLGFISWFLLCAGITVFNSYYDKDKGPVAGLERPPATTRLMLVGAWMLKLFGLIIALYLNSLFLLIYIVGIVLSVLYSHRIFRFKSNGYVAVLFNFIIGAMTFVAASSFSSANTEIVLWGGVTAGIFLVAMYLMMQVHQVNEDKARKDISIAVLFGRIVTITVAILLLIIAAILSIITLLTSGLNWFFVAILVIYFVVILTFSFNWLQSHSGSVSDFKIMNRLTLRLSYAANFIFIIIYIINVVLGI